MLLPYDKQPFERLDRPSGEPGSPLRSPRNQPEPTEAAPEFHTKSDSAKLTGCAGEGPLAPVSPLIFDAWVVKGEANCTPDPTTGCLLWQGRTQKSSGHGKMSFWGKDWLVHRAAWVSQRGRVPEDMHLHHTCFQPACANVEHLALVTPAEHLRIHRERSGGLR
jgi:hypothetical protein